MSVLPSDDHSAVVRNQSSYSKSHSSLTSNLVGATFIGLAVIAMAGWLYLIAKLTWASINWLSF